MNLYIKYLKFFLVLFICTHNYMFSQLSDLHYLPPLKQRTNNLSIREQAIYLSTPNTTTFKVNIYRGTSTSILDSLSLSKSNPIRYPLADGDNNITLVTNVNTGVVLANSGLRLEAPLGEKFYVNYRGVSHSQAASLTSKGRQALGTDFRWGGPVIRDTQDTVAASLGIMATEDNTVVNITGYNPNCEFRLQKDPDGITSNKIQISLNKGESYVLEAIKRESRANTDGWIGAKIRATKDIVISNGALNFGVLPNRNSLDAGIDQPVPINKIGKEYVFIRGNGGNVSEFPLIIGTQNNTKIYVNGSSTPIATINDGDYFEIPGNNYSGNKVGANMLVTTSKDAYAYQIISGGHKIPTVGLNFIAPVNCLLPSILDFIPDIDNIAGKTLNGGVTIIASTSTPNEKITVKDGARTIKLPKPKPVKGSSDWKTFYIGGLTDNVSVKSSGPIAVGFLGFSGVKGVAGYFSGFDNIPVVNLEITGKNGCLPPADILPLADIEVVGEAYDAYQWYGDGVEIAGATTNKYTPSIAGDYFLKVRKGSCSYDSQPIYAYYCDPDIVLKKTADKNDIAEGDTATFTITVQSLGIDDVTNLIITDVIPSGLSLLSATPSVGTWVAPNWNIGTISSGNLVTISLKVKADKLSHNSSTKSYTNLITNTQDQIDSNRTTDDPSEIITVSYITSKTPKTVITNRNITYRVK